LNATSREKHIGQGSFGEVLLTEFRNTDKEPAEKVVVKRMLEMQDEEDTKRFIRRPGAHAARRECVNLLSGKTERLLSL